MSDYREPIVSTLFKPVPDGYVFRAPSPFVFGPARHYLVNEAQKATITAILMPPRPMLRSVALVVPLTLWLVVFTQVIVRFGFDLVHLTNRDIVVMSGLFIIPFVTILQIFHWWNQRPLRPVLADLPRTIRRIPNRDLYPALVEAMPAWNLALLGFGLGAICLGNASTLAASLGRYHFAWDASSLLSLALVVLTGVPAAYLLVRAIRKAKRQRRPSGAATGAAFAVALGLLAVAMTAAGVYGIVSEYQAGQRVSHIQSRQERLQVRIDAIAKEVASAKPSDDRRHLESLRTRLDAISREIDALKRDRSNK